MPPWIEVHIPECFREWREDEPSAEFTLLYRLCFAQILYHEIGHHHHHWFQHGVRKQQREAFAEQFAREQCVKLLTECRGRLMNELPKFWHRPCFPWIWVKVGTGRFIELLLTFGGERAEWLKRWMMQFAPEVESVPEGHDPEGFSFMKRQLAPLIQKVRGGKL